MARKLIVEVVLDAAAYSRQIKKAEAQTAGFAGNLQKSSKHAVQAGVSIHGLGKSLAFATGGLVAFHSGTEFIRESVDAAREAEIAQRSLAAQMKTSGESFDVVRSRIEETTKSFARFGFQNDEVIQSLAILDRGTGNIDEAMKLQGLTADIARAKNIDLAQAAAVVAKVFGGQETALRRAVPGLEKTAHGWDLIGAAQRKVAGQAAANTTAAEKFHATLHDTEELIGKLLLPTFDKALGRLSKFLDAFNQSAAAQEHHQQKTSDTVKGLHVLIDSTKNAAHWFNNLGGSFFTATDAFKLMRTDTYVLWFLRELGKRSKDAAVAIGSVTNAIEDQNKAITGRARSGLGPPHVGTTGAHAPGADKPKPKPGASATQKNTWFDNVINIALGDVQDIQTAQGRIDAYKQLRARVWAEIKRIHDPTRRINLTEVAKQISRSIAGEQGTIASNEQTQKGNRKAAIAAAKQEHEDWLAFAYEKAQTTKTIKDDLRTAQANLNYWKLQARTGKYTVDEARQVLFWQEELKKIRKQGRDSDPLAGLMQVSSARLASILAAGTGLGAAGRAILGANIAGAEIQPLHVHVNIDGREVGRAVTNDQARTGRRTASQTSGRRG